MPVPTPMAGPAPPSGTTTTPSTTTTTTTTTTSATSASVNAATTAPGATRATKAAAVERWLRDTPLPPGINVPTTRTSRDRKRPFANDVQPQRGLSFPPPDGNKGPSPSSQVPAALLTSPNGGNVHFYGPHFGPSPKPQTSPPRTPQKSPPSSKFPPRTASVEKSTERTPVNGQPNLSSVLFPPRASIDEKHEHGPHKERMAGRTEKAHRMSFRVVTATNAKPIDEDEEKPLGLTPAGVQRMSVVMQPVVAEPLPLADDSQDEKPKRHSQLPTSIVIPAVAPSAEEAEKGSPESDQTDSILDGRQMLGDDYAESTVSSSSEFVPPKVLLRSQHRESLVPSLHSVDEGSESGTSFGESITMDGGSSDLESDLGSISSNAMANASLTERMQVMKQRAKKAKDRLQSFEAARFIVDNVQFIDKMEQKPYCELAIKQLKKLSIAGTVEAQYLLANLYISGIPGFQEKHKPDYSKAFNLYSSAAKKDHPEALFHVGLCYEQGAGVAQSNNRALHNYRKAAVSNHPGAMFRLGMSLLKGELGQGKNPRDGVKWLKLAAKYANEKYPQALYELALLHDRGVHNVVWPDHEYLVELLTQGAALGHGASQFKLGEAYEYGHFGVVVDAGRSVYYYSLAAANGSLEAMFELGGWYLTGADDPKTDFHLIQSDTEAHRWVSLAAEGGLPKAMFAMGYFCEMGIGRDKHLERALEWYRKAAAGGDAKAKKKLEELGVPEMGKQWNVSETGVKKNKKKGTRCLVM
ncbi:hypothetical protein SpCBS45565_g02972 [Spizellomyces sp. 'palustris']|nr:hypothetical protein SpCBS45565_g02972 [Spizellomyces sp. 'palustris']